MNLNQICKNKTHNHLNKTIYQKDKLFKLQFRKKVSLTNNRELKINPTNHNINKFKINQIYHSKILKINLTNNNNKTYINLINLDNKVKMQKVKFKTYNKYTKQ